MTTLNATREVKLKMSRDGLCAITKAMDSFVLLPRNDMELMVQSILCDVFRSCKKKIIDQKPKYTITLKVHEAITLRRVLLAGGYPYDSYEENEVRIITGDIARQL